MTPKQRAKHRRKLRRDLEKLAKKREKKARRTGSEESWQVSETTGKP
jgi:hypothetical protein